MTMPDDTITNARPKRRNATDVVLPRLARRVAACFTARAARIRWKAVPAGVGFCPSRPVGSVQAARIAGRSGVGDSPWMSKLG